MNAIKLLKFGGVVGAVGVFVWGTLLTVRHVRSDPFRNATYGFQYFEPAALPAGLVALEKRVSMPTMSDGKVLGLSAEIKLRSNDWVYTVREKRYDNEEVTTKLENYDTKSVQPTCKQASSAKDVSYRLCHWIDYGTISVTEVKFVQHNTLVTATFPTSLDIVISEDEIGTYIDSFTPADASSWPVLRGVA